MLPLRPSVVTATVVFLGLLTLREAGSAPTSRAVDFARDVQPILSENCFACHGPHAEAREAELRLDTFEGATAEGWTGFRAVVPGALEESELWVRINEEDPADRMPPPYADKVLTDREREILGRWIEEGAEYARHWSFVPPTRSAPPALGDEAGIENEIDRFVRAHLQAEGLAPSPEAERPTLIRRLSLGLTGLPPTPAEVEDFVTDDAPDAYARLVDRLLASPRYGEHMARFWLDAARYGDTHGFHLDNQRAVWRWRDWVIDAFNANQPFDEFTVEQLAGDLLPDPTLEQRIATGFNRCNPTTGEGGLIEEEYLARYAMDRVETTSTVWLGLTVGCARCHDHKFDPLPQKEYYGLYAYFGSLAEEGTDRNALTPPPSIKAPYPAQAAALVRLDAALDTARAKLAEPLPEVDAEQGPWEAAARAELARRWSPMAPHRAATTNGATLTVLGDGTVLAGGDNPDRETYELTYLVPGGVTALRLRTHQDPSLPLGGTGRADNANFVLSEVEIETAPLDAPEAWQRIPLVHAEADYSQPEYPVAATLDGDPETGWGVNFQPVAHLAVFAPAQALARPDGSPGSVLLRLRLRQDSRHVRHAIGRFGLDVSTDAKLAPATAGEWHMAGPFAAADARAAFDTAFAPESELAHGIDLATVDEAGAPRWTPRPDIADGARVDFVGDNSAVYLHRRLTSPTARRAVLAIGSDDALVVWLNGERVHANYVARALAADQVAVDLRAGSNELLVKVVNFAGQFAFSYAVAEEERAGLPPAVAIALLDPTRRGAGDDDPVRRHFREKYSPRWSAADRELRAIEAERAAIDAALPVTMVWEERAEPRPTHVLLRGQYDKPGEEVAHGVPACLPPLPPDAPPDRLALARWLTDLDHPLTARVFVNRLWAQHFGTGLVATPGNFGAQGAYPSHPALLDWLAREFVESGWDVKHMHRLLVSSATYRQASRVTPETLARDPANRLLARGPRVRLDAEVIRDQALQVAGLLVEKLGGPSVKPVQPDGLWKVVAYPSSNTARFVPDMGDKRHRRSLYTFWKRTSPPPNMTAFDAPNREVCSVERARTNTPLQALVLLNDEQFVEAARALGARMLREGGDDDGARASYGFRLVTSRTPHLDELAVLLEVLAAERAVYADDAAAAEALLAGGVPAPAADLDAREWAAWTLLANMLLNLDEAITAE